MEIFIDSANTDSIRKWLDTGVIDGVTTNPSIMYSDGVFDAETGAKAIADTHADADTDAYTNADRRGCQLVALRRHYRRGRHHRYNYIRDVYPLPT